MVPPFQDIMLPLLRLAEQANGQPMAIRDAVQKLANEMGLSEDERTELLPSGRQSRFANREAWAASHLRGAKILESAGRGFVTITQRRRDLLASNVAAKKHTLRSLPGTFSGLQLVSLMYTGMKLIDPTADACIDLSQEFAAAKALFEKPEGNN